MTQPDTGNNIEGTFVIPREECEKRVANGEGVREYDEAVAPDLYVALANAREEIVSVGIETNAEANAETRLRRDSREKAYPNDIEFAPPKHAEERKAYVISTLIAMIIDGLTEELQHGTLITNLRGIHTEENLGMGPVFLTIDPRELRKKGIRAEPWQGVMGTKENHEKTLQSWLGNEVSAKVTEYLQNLEIDGTKPFAQNTFKIHRTYNDCTKVSLCIEKS